MKVGSSVCFFLILQNETMVSSLVFLGQLPTASHALTVEEIDNRPK